MESDLHSTWISQYLESHPKYSSASTLEGGVSNYLYRLTDLDGSTVILKHAEPYAAHDKNWTFGIERIACERAALSSVRTTLLSSPAACAAAVEIPRVISYDDNGHNLIMSDCGTTTKDLHTAFPSLTPERRVAYGRRLGLWLAALHQCAVVDKAIFTANETAKDRKGMDQRITSLSAGLPLASQGSATLAEIELEQQRFKDELEPFVLEVKQVKEAGCIIHGDFWPGNLLVGSSLDTQGNDLLAVIDWESASLGTGASDVGIFAAEAWLLCHFHSTSARAAIMEPEDFSMLDAFLASYLEVRGEVDENFVREAILQFAVNLSVGRGGKDLMFPVKRFGCQIVGFLVGKERDWKAVSELDWGMEAWKIWVRDL